MATFYWVGSTGKTASAYDYNHPENWRIKTIVGTTGDSTAFSYLTTATRVPSAGDDVFIGSEEGPTAVSPLLYGGFSGPHTNGGWANSVGATFAASTNNILNSFTVMAEWNPNKTGVQNKYPFSIVGGGKDSVWRFGGFGGSGATQTPGLTGDDLSDRRYSMLNLKCALITDFTTGDNTTGLTGSFISQRNNKSVSGARQIKLNLVKCLNSRGTPINIYSKGTKYSGWDDVGIDGNPGPSAQYQEFLGDPNNGGSPTSKSEVILSGFLNEFQDNSRPSSSWIKSGNLGYGYPNVILQGCTLGSYVGSNLCPVFIDHRSTIGNVRMSVPFVYSVGQHPLYITNSVNNTNSLTDTMLKLQGEQNAGKALSSLGYSVTGGIGTTSGVGPGEIFIKTTPEIRKNEVPLNWSTSLPSVSFIEIGVNQFETGLTSFAKVGKLNIEGTWQYNSGYGANQLHLDNCQIGEAIVNNTIVRAKQNISSFSANIGFGILDMRQYSRLNLNAVTTFNNWGFGVTASGGTAQVGGLLSDDLSTISTSSGVALFNRVTQRVITSGGGGGRYDDKTGIVTRFDITEVNPDSRTETQA